MKYRRALIVVTLLVEALVSDCSSSAVNDINTLSNDNHPTSSDEHKLLLECQHSDYRTYIKCLKRQKRHHGHGGHHNDTGDTKTCFEDCGIDQCTSIKCVHDCHTRCMKKTKETRQIITQYETECVSGDCNKSDLPITNITTNVDINNIINNHINSDTLSGKGNKTSHTGTDSKCIPGNCCQGCCGGCQQNTPGFGLTLVPQIQLVPQITYGIGMGPIGGCLFSMNWPCLQPSQPMNQPMPFDCSQCGNPVFRYKCDTTCYNVGPGNSPDPIRHDGNNRSMCQSPSCVGGSN